jgi:hypothetical protein
MAIFTLKQPAHGWTDNPPQDGGANAKNSCVLDDIRRYLQSEDPADNL